MMDTRDAIQEARNRGIDLVEIAPKAQPPVCKLIDYGKFLYEQKKKAHEAKKKQVTVQVKEIKFRPGTDDHDYEYRMQHALDWLDGGDKVRASIAFRGREMTHRELGAKILKRLTEDLSEVADVEIAPKMEGYQMFTIFLPKKGKADVKKAQQHSSEPPNKVSEKKKEKTSEPEKNKERPAAKKAVPKKKAADDEEIF